MCSAGPTRSSPHAGWRATPGAFALAAAFAATPCAAHAQEGVIAGSVITEVGARPNAGAQVAVQDQAGKGAGTDADGRFRITGVALLGMTGAGCGGPTTK